jgi:hypothetical protein
MKHKATNQDSDAAALERRAIIQKVNDKNLDFESFTRETTIKKSGLREEMANLEDQLRKLRDRKCELEILNRNLEMIVDTEASLRKAKETAESQAVRAVNTDLKDHIS